MSAAQTQSVELKFIPVSKIVTEEGHNPRGEVKVDERLTELTNTVEDRGVRTPVLLRSRGDEFVIIAGERRWHAAIAAKLPTIPAVVEPETPDDDTPEARARRKVDAIVENLVRVDVDPLGLADTFGELRALGFNAKEIAARIGKRGDDGVAYVRRYLRVLELPLPLQAAVDAHAIPVKAVATLADLTAIRPELATLAAARVLTPPEDFDPADRLSWDDLKQRPIAVVSALYSEFGGDQPDDVYTIGETYRYDRFDLPELAVKHLTQIREAFGQTNSITLNDAAADHADALKALFADKKTRNQWHERARIIVGKDVASQIVTDWIANRAKEARAETRLRSETRRAAEERRAALVAAGRSDGTATDQPPAEGDSSDVDAPGADDSDSRDLAEEARLEREAIAARRLKAEAFNTQLGSAIVTRLASLRVDVRVVKILAGVDLDGRLADIAHCGARLCLPGWVEEKSTAGGATRRVYIEPKAECEKRAANWLSNAKKLGEVSGRAVSLIVLAVFADQHAVAQSYRSQFTIEPKAVPWADTTHDLIDELVLDVLGDELLGEKIADRRTLRAERRAAEEARAQSRAKLMEQVEAMDTVSDEDLSAMPALADDGFGRGYTGDWVERDRILRAVDAEVAARQLKREEATPFSEDEAKAALAHVLDQLGDGLGLDTLDEDQLNDVVTLAGGLDPRERAAVLAAVEQHRQQQDDEHADDVAVAA
jgi:ParB/RepB/Spo0J family partition protein